MHDDLWFWGSSRNNALAWGTIQEFAGVMGLTLIDSKTGSVEIDGKSGQEGASKQLPLGQIIWGFLKMESTGKWTLDDTQVEQHVRELQRQLSACKGILSLVQAWNLYVTRFLTNNFGDPANCLGRPHVNMAIEAFEKIQRTLFASDELPGDNVLEHLRLKLYDGFDVSHIPDGFFYFPVELGGLGLRNPFVPLFLLHRHSEKDPVEIVEKGFELEEEDYAKAEKCYENGTSRSRFHSTSTDVDSFMSLEEYTSYLEETIPHLEKAYTNLLDTPSKGYTDYMPGVESNVPAELNNDYDQWVVKLYGSEIVRKYGGLAMGEKRLLPIGLVSMLRGEKVRWQG
jgi:hypothetical protein